MIWQQLADGIATGAVYGALALAIVLVYRASRTLNFAQGELALLGAYVSWQLTAWGLPIGVALPISMVLLAALCAGFERVLFRPLVRRHQHLPLIIVSLGLMIALNAVIGWIWTYQTKEVPALFGSGAVLAGGVAVSRQDIGIVMSVLALALVLAVLLRSTRTGLRMRAAVSAPESAELSGVSTGRMMGLGWAMAGAIGALAGTLIAPELFLHPGMMAPVLIYAFAAATLGGLDSPVGALVGGVVVGVVENLAGSYVPGVGGELKQIFALVIIVAVLLLRPQGLFGRKELVRV
ncbi:branched-chain amino acid ABC transporter permease [Microbacterium telephonicum]|uniref:Amino acid/amide ABC transporter membrane protein 1 (HAAT family) n=1 Tax=Microbacterium telephonicum TaxID=1714841 RepID=A0A498BRU5_9MICO|nr:branched-chain amino acid ABC transporter permease [Microbacterium telephonicum]RLK46704.1 amino acid/amide ABC transporter membrane protein 1 (HAAT family) [Microbacterium telephonicum]